MIGHSVRSRRYRYIYYPALGLEELYDHRTDPNEYDNIAYRKENRPILSRHRQVLLELIPDLKWSGSAPEGYRIRNWQIKNINYRPITEIAY